MDSLARLGHILRMKQLLNELCYNLYGNGIFGSGQVELDLRKLSRCHPALQRRLIRMALADARGDLDGVGHTHVEAVIDLAGNGQTGSHTTIPAGSLNKTRIQVLVRYGYLIFREEGAGSSTPAFDEYLPVPGRIFLEDLNLSIRSAVWDKSKGFSFSPRCIYIDRDKVKGRLQWQRGRDRFGL